MKQVFTNIGIIIQARMGSTRLPSKIMMTVNNRPIFQSEINRLKSIGYPLYIATTTKPADISVVSFAEENGLRFYRGDENNVLSRYYQCALEYKLDLIVRLTSDCPLIDPLIIKDGIEQYMNIGDNELYLSNTLIRSYPRGFDFEIFSFHLLENAFQNAVEASDLEHVTPYINQNKSGAVHIKQITRLRDDSKYRLTLDTPEDFELLKILIEKYNADLATGEDIIELMHAHPELVKINQHIEQKKN